MIFIVFFLLFLICSYFLPVVPQLFLIQIVFISYTIKEKSFKIVLYVVLLGFISDVFFLHNYFFHTFFYFIFFQLSFRYFRKFIILDYHTIPIFVFFFLIFQEISYFLFDIFFNIQSPYPFTFKHYFIENLTTIVLSIIIFKYFGKKFMVQKEQVF